MQVVVGLRNPGTEYEGTRHNIGYDALLELADRLELRLKRGPLRVRCQVARSAEVILAAPLTFMNESGRAVGSLLSYFKALPADLLVLHDDIDLGFGRLRLQVGGGSGGHNGIKSLERALSGREFSRLKIGVGRPVGSREATDHVLGRFTPREKEEAAGLAADAAAVAELWLTDRARAQENAAHRGR
ncbi:MAG TPA: aminoacyl-tRNA hydrolase [Acidimicrobiia bacterium]|nr:aminoacyl-tRNA hydrolase [Acidimicrobiia bacterium]